MGSGVQRARAAVNASAIALLAFDSWWALGIALAFGAAFAIGKATAGDSADSGGGAQPVQLPDNKPQAPSIAAPAALPVLQQAPEPAGGTAPAPGGGSGSAPAPAPTPAPAPAPPSGGGGDGPIIEG